MLFPAIRPGLSLKRFGTAAALPGDDRNAHVAARQRELGERRSTGRFHGSNHGGERPLRRKLTLNCAVQQNEIDPLPPVRRRPVNSGFVTGTEIPQLDNLGISMLETAGSAKWRSRPGPVLVNARSHCVDSSP